MASQDHNIPPPRRPRRWRRWLVEGTLAAAGLLFGLSLALHYAVSDAQLTGIVQNALTKVLAGKVQVGRVHWSWPTRVQIDDVRVATATDQPVLTLRHASARLHVAPLLHKNIVVGPVQLDGGDVTLAQANNGNLTIADAFTPRDTEPTADSNDTSTWTVRLEDVRITHTNLAVDMPGLSANVRDVQLEDGALRVDDAGLALSADVRTPRLALNTADLSLPPTPVHLQVQDGGYLLAKGAMVPHAEALTVELPGLTLTAQGQTILEDGNAVSDTSLSAEVHLDTDAPSLHAILSEAPAKSLQLRGHLDLNATLLGDSNHQTIDVHGTGTNLRVAGADVQTVDAALSHEDDTWRAESLAVATAQGKVEARGHVSPSNHEVDVRAIDLALRPLVAPWVSAAANALPAHVSGEVHAEGGALAPLDTNVILHADARGMPTAQVPGVPERLQLTAHAHVAPEAVTVQSLTVEGDGAELQGHGQVPRVPGGMLQASATLVHTAPSATLEKLHVPVRAAEVQATVDASGTLEAPVVNGALEVREVEAEGLPSTRITMPVQFAKGVLRLDGATVDNAAVHLVARAQAVLQGRDGAWLAEPDCDGEALASAIDLAKVPGLGMQGTGDVQVRFHGNLLQPRGSASVHLHRVAWRTVDIDEAVALVHGGGTAWQIDSMGLHTRGGGSAQVTGKVDGRTRALRGDLRVHKLPLAWISAATGSDTPMGGTLEMDGSVQGTLDAMRISINATAPFVESSVRAAVEPGRHFVDGNLHATGTLQDVLGAVSAPASAKGEMALAVQARGNWAAPVVTASLQVSELDVQDSSIGTGHAQVILSTRRPEAGNTEGTHDTGSEADANVLQRTYDVAVDVAHLLTGKGTVALAPDSLMADGAVQFAELHAADWLPALRLRGIDVFGQGTLQAHYQSRAGLRGALHVERLTAKVEQQKLELAEPVDLQLSQRTLHITDLLLKGTPGRFHLEGNIGATLDAAADARLDMEFVSALVPALGAATGTLALQLQAHGPLTDPIVQGALSIASPVTLRPRNTLLELRVDAGSIALQKHQVVLEGLTGKMGGGTFNLTGDVQLHDMQPAAYNVHLRGNDLPIHTQDLVVEANITADAVGEGLLPLIRGRVDIIRGRYLKKFVLQDFNFVSRAPDTSTPLAQRMPELRDLRLDILTASLSGMDVKVDAGAFAVQADIETDLHITGSVLAPHIDGKVSAARGTLTFPKANLQLTQAVLDFVPGRSGQPDTSITVVAEGDVTPSSSSANPSPQTFSVTLKLDGSLEKMNLDLESNPALGRLDVLTLLTTGHASLSDLTQGGNNSDSSTLDAALAFAGSQVSGPITAFAQKQLERTLNLRLDLAAEVTQSAVRVTAAKTINSRLRLEGAYQLGTGTDQSTAVSTRAQLSLTDRFLLQGGALRDLTQSSSTPTTGAIQSSLELRWRLVGN